MDQNWILEHVPNRRWATTFVAVSLLVALFAPLGPAQPKPPQTAKASPGKTATPIKARTTIAAQSKSSIDPELLRTWLTYLSSDELEGRAAFSEGLGLAAAYIADQLKASGVKPGGDHGTYFQRVEVLGVNATNHSTLTVEVNGKTRVFKDGEGITFPRNVGGKRTLTLDQVEFVGYGLDLSAAHDDYQGVDAKGKAVVWLGANGPKGTDVRQLRRQLTGRPALVIEEHGAGASIAPPAAPAGGRGANGGNANQASANPPAVTQPAATQANTTAANNAAATRVDFTTTQVLGAVIAPRVTATDAFLEFLFSGSDMNYAQLKALADKQEDLPKFTLKNVKLTFHLDADYKVVNTRYTRNVVGLVEGSDAALKTTYVGFGAHYDHTGYTQGVLPPEREDRINNGADDDGSGTTALIGLARAFANGPRTKRSLLFVWHSGEESGLWGSRYFADHPLVPLESIVAQLNIDMIGRRRDNADAEANTIYLVGADRISSELHNLAVDANASLRAPMTISYEMNDSRDLERVYYRSDHYSYAAKGIPIVFFTGGLHPDYHRPSDSVEKIDFDKLAATARLVEETGRRVANLDHAPVRDNLGPRTGKSSAGKVAVGMAQ